MASNSRYSRLQTGSVKPTSSNQTTASKATSLIESIVANPTMPTGTTISPQLQNVATNELMSTAGVSGSAAAALPTATAAPTIAGTAAPTSTASTVPTAQTANTYTQAGVAGSTPTMTGAHRYSNSTSSSTNRCSSTDSTVRGQLASLQSDVETAVAAGDPLPVWARGAAKATEAAMANRGMSQSSMAAEALAEGIMNSAIPIAKADADTYKQMIFQNLANNQQAAITNAQAYLQMDMANLSNNNKLVYLTCKQDNHFYCQIKQQQMQLINLMLLVKIKLINSMITCLHKCLNKMQLEMMLWHSIQLVKQIKFQH